MPGLDFGIICPQLIGRNEELAALEAAVSERPPSSRPAILISGEAGIGKSRLVRELRGSLEAQSWHVAEMVCFEQAAQVPFSGIKDLLERLTRREDYVESSAFHAHSSRVRTLLSPSEQLAAAPEQREQIVDAFRELLTEVAQQRRCLLVVEDLHWCDGNTLDALLFLIRHASERPWHLVITFRPEELPPSVLGFLADLDRERLCSELRLDALSLSETDEMLKAIFHSSRSTSIDLLQRLHRLTEGNPFFVEEMLRSIVGNQPSPQLANLRLESAQVPRTVLDAVGQRVELLSPSARSLLEIAAVVGTRFAPEHLQAITQNEEDHLLADLRELVQCQLILEEEDGFAFRHALTREAVASRLLRRQKVILHQRISAFLESRDDSAEHPEELSYHFFEAGDWEKARQYAELAGTRALGMFAPAIALEHYSRAIDAATRGSVEVSSSTYRRRASAFEALGDFEGARGDLDRAIEVANDAGDLSGLIDCLLDLGLLWASRDYAQTLGYYNRALDAAQRLGDRGQIARCLSRLGNGLSNTGDFDRALPHFKDALQVQRQLGERQAIAGTLDLIGMAGLMSGQFRDSLAAYREALSLMDPGTDRRNRISVLASIPVLSGTYQTAVLAPALSLLEATSYAEEAIRLAREVAVPSDLSYALWQASFWLGPQGRIMEALAMAHESLRLAIATEHKQWENAGHGVLGAIYTDLLQPADALPHLRRGMELSSEIGSPIWVAQMSALLTDALLLDGRVDEAAALLQLEDSSPIEPPRSMLDVWLMSARAEVAFASGDYAQTRLIIEALAETREPGIRLHRLLGLMAFKEGDLASAASLLGHLALLAGNHGNKSLEWRLYSDVAHCLLADGRRDKARDVASSAIKVVDEIAANVEQGEEFRRAALLALPAVLRERPTRRSPSMLTARELEIAALIAAGLTNRDIANRLVLSSRTVETHVANAMAKLGFSSRAQLAAWFAEGDFSPTQ